VNPNNNQLLQVSTSDGLYLHGFYCPTSDKKNALLHIHGFEGNFYENNFVYSLIKNLSQNNIAFLAVNTRGNNKNSDFNTVDGGCKTIGSWNELLEEAHIDISAWIKFLLDQGYQEIILQGHSLGTLKVIRYLFEGEYKDKISKLILLSPFEKHTPSSDLSPQTFESWDNQSDFARVFDFSATDYGFPILKQIKIPTKIIVGEKDEYFYPTNPNDFQKIMNLLLSHIPNSQGVFIPDAIHSYKPNEELMAKEVTNFIKQL
jgi:pimeloyl-ACP methyl ester carboxylesterase